LLCGPEVHLPDGYSFRDKEGNERVKIRSRWWDLRAGETFGAVCMPEPMDCPHPLLERHLERVPDYPPDAPPAFCGHFWLPPDREPGPLRHNVICLDHSAGLGGPLVACRWNGPTLAEWEFVKCAPDGTGHTSVVEDKTPPLALEAIVGKDGKGGVPVWGVYTVDIYESCLGDGYFPYLGRLFYDEATAKRWADYIRDFSGRTEGKTISTGFGTEVRQLRLKMDGGTLTLTPPNEGAAPIVISDREGGIPAAFSGIGDWHSILKHCRELWPEEAPPGDDDEPEDEPGPDEDEDTARLRVYGFLCALRDSYNYGTIVPVLADPEKLRHAMQTATQQWERDESEVEEYALESWRELNRSDQEKIIAMARELWGGVVAGAFPSLNNKDPETRTISDLTDDEFRDFIDRSTGGGLGL
jgi:hypothetical protein